MIERLFSPELIHAMGWTLVHTLWQGALFALLLGILLIVLQKQSAQSRYIISVGMLGAFFLTVGFTFFQLYFNADHDVNVIAEVITESQFESYAFEGEELSDTNEFGEPEHTTFQVTTYENSSVKKQGFFQKVIDYYDRNLPLIVTIWLMGVLFLQLRLLGRLAYVQRLKNYGTNLFPSEWAERIEELEDRMRIQSKVNYLTSYRVSSPMTVGWLKPVIIFPENLIGQLKDSQVYAILAHELAHIKRNDFIANVIQQLLSTVFFYHPGVWWMSARIEEEREHCCDDLAIQLTKKPVGYAKTLIELKEKEMAGLDLVMAYTGPNKKGGFTERISRLLSGYTRKGTFTEGFTSALILCMAFSLSVIATGQNPVPMNENRIYTDSFPEPPVPPAPPAPPSPPSPPSSGNIPNPPNPPNVPNPPNPPNPGSEGYHYHSEQELFMEAVWEGQYKSVNYFIDKGVDVNYVDSDHGFTPLMAAASENYPEIAQLLIDNGAKVDQVHHRGWTALIEAVDEGSLEVARILIDNGATIGLHRRGNGRSALTMAASENNLDILILLINSGGDPLDNLGGRPLLHEAAEEGNSEIMEYLLQIGVDFDQKDKEGRTALTYAAEEDNLACVRMLLKNGADLEAKDIHGRTAFSYAVQEGVGNQILELLKVHDDNHNSFTTNKESLLIACEENNINAVNFIVKSGVSVNNNYPNNYTPLMAAVREGNQRIVSYLIEQGADVNAVTVDHNRTPLFFASSESEVAIAQLLIEAGASIDPPSTHHSGRFYNDRSRVSALSFFNNVTPVYLAIDEDEIQMLKLLIKSGTNVNKRIHKVKVNISENNVHIDLDDNLQNIESLLKKKGVKLVYNTENWTPLMEAAEKGNSQLVKLLLQAGADKTVQMENGKTALDLAIRLRHTDIVQRLK